MDFNTLTTYGWFGFALVLWFGLCVGSFLNVVIHRLPIMLNREWTSQARYMLKQEKAQNESDADADADADAHANEAKAIEAEAAAADTQDNIEEQPAEEQTEEAEPAYNLMVPRSACPKCGHQITALQNIPVISWLFLGGKCANCKAPISVRYPFVELATALATLMVVATFGFTWLALLVCILTWILIAAFGIDYDTQLLPDQLTYPVLWLGLIANLGSNGLTSLPDAVIGAIAGYLFLWSIYWAFKLTTGKEGMGYGDFKLFAGLGAWLGWQMLPNVILVAAVLGLIYALSLVLRGKQTSAQPIPFGPFLAASGWFGVMYGDVLAQLTLA